MRVKTAAKTVVKRGIVEAASLVRPATAGMRGLVYHHVVEVEEHDPGELTVSASLLERQCAYLREHGYRVAEAAAVVKAIRSGSEPEDKSVLLTFDDGYVDTYSLALPVLERYRFPATVFVVADALTDRARPVAEKSYMDIRQAREIVAGGLMSVGCHGATHSNLRGLSDDALRRETAGAKQRIEDALGTAVKLFAYPFGSYDAWDARVRGAVEAAGFEGAFTSIAGPNTSRTDPFLLLRSRVSWAEDVRYFGHLLSGAYDWHARWQWLRARRSGAA